MKGVVWRLASLTLVGVMLIGGVHQGHCARSGGCAGLWETWACLCRDGGAGKGDRGPGEGSGAGAGSWPWSRGESYAGGIGPL